MITDGFTLQVHLSHLDTGNEGPWVPYYMWSKAFRHFYSSSRPSSWFLSSLAETIQTCSDDCLLSPLTNSSTRVFSLFISTKPDTFRLGWQEGFTAEEVGLLSRILLPFTASSIFFVAFCVLPELWFPFWWLMAVLTHTWWKEFTFLKIYQAHDFTHIKQISLQTNWNKMF